MAFVTSGVTVEISKNKAKESSLAAEEQKTYPWNGNWKKSDESVFLAGEIGTTYRIINDSHLEDTE